MEIPQFLSDDLSDDLELAKLFGLGLLVRLELVELLGLGLLF